MMLIQLLLLLAVTVVTVMLFFQGTNSCERKTNKLEIVQSFSCSFDGEDYQKAFHFPRKKSILQYYETMSYQRIKSGQVVI